MRSVHEKEFPMEDMKRAQCKKSLKTILQNFATPTPISPPLNEPSWVGFCASKNRVVLPAKCLEQGGVLTGGGCGRKSKAFPVKVFNVGVGLFSY
jgi:hypothetical protein